MIRSTLVAAVAVLSIAVVVVGHQTLGPTAGLASAIAAESVAAAPAPAVESTEEAVGAQPRDPVPRARRPRPVTSPSPEPPPEPPAVALSSEGWAVLQGTGGVVGEDGGLITYSVELEPGLDETMADFAEVVTGVLEDPVRGWTAARGLRVQRVDVDADVRVVLATPATVDAHCARVGLRTNGRFSCWVGDRAMLNADRWRGGADPHPDLDTYRAYLVNHEVGHGLGFGHVGCPGRGRPAPVMMQQTKSVGACTPNGWPTS